MNRCEGILVLWLVCVTHVSLHAAAQDTTGVGSLSGSVVDAAGAPAAFATICLASTTSCVVADERGAFRLLNLRAGEYALKVTTPGDTALPVGRFEVRAGVDQRLEITLPARNRLETTVTVTAPSVTAPTEVKTSVQLIGSQEIFRAAGALQDVSRYLQTLPGVVIGSDDFPQRHHRARREPARESLHHRQCRGPEHQFVLQFRVCGRDSQHC